MTNKFTLPSLLLLLSLSYIGMDAVGLISCHLAEAQSVKIVDCNGKTRAFREQLSPNESNVRVDVVNDLGQPIQSGEVNLINAQGKLITATIADGSVDFVALEPGVWMISSPNAGVFFTQIALSDFFIPPFWQAAGAGIAQVGEIALVVGAVVGATVIANEVSDGGGGSSDSSTPPVSDVCLSCDPDATAPSIPDFE